MNAADDGSAVSGGSAASQVRISPHWSSTPRYVRIGTTTPPRPTRCTNYIALATLWRGGRVSYRLYEIFVDEDVQIPCHNSGSLSEGDYGAIVTSLGFEAHMKCEAMPARQRHVLQSRQVRAGRLYGVAEPDLFVERHGAHPTGEMTLRGMRLAVMSESGRTYHKQGAR